MSARVAKMAFELLNKLASEPPHQVIDGHIVWLRREVENECKSANLPYEEVMRAALKFLQETNRPLVDKLFRIARNTDRTHTVLTMVPDADPNESWGRVRAPVEPVVL